MSAPSAFGPLAPHPGSDFVYINPDPSGYLGHLTPKQDEILQAMRANNYTCIESQSPGQFVIDDACLLRFLRARKFDLAKADAMLSQHLAWRDEHLPCSVAAADVAALLRTGMTRFGPYTKTGLPVLMIRVEDYDPAQIPDLNSFIQYCAFFFQRAITKLPRGAEKAVLFFDMKGWSLRRHATPFSMKCIAELISIIQAHNPERLQEVILFNAPMLFSGTWKIIKQMIDPVVAGKIKFVSDFAPVLELVDAEFLPKEYGGKRELPYPIEGLDELS